MLAKSSKAKEVIFVQDIDELFAKEPETPEPEAPEPSATVDYGEWKRSVEELEKILDQEDEKFDPKSAIEKEYSNLEKLAQETKVTIM